MIHTNYLPGRNENLAMRLFVKADFPRPGYIWPEHHWMREREQEAFQVLDSCYEAMYFACA